jgi:hypothetical protein
MERKILSLSSLPFKRVGVSLARPKLQYMEACSVMELQTECFERTKTSLMLLKDWGTPCQRS